MELLLEIISNLYDAVLGVYFITRFCEKKFKDSIIIEILVMALVFGVSTVFLFVEVHVLIHSAIILTILILFSTYINKGISLRTIIAPIIFEGALITSSTLLMFALSNIFGTNVLQIISVFGFQRCLYIFLCKLLMTSVLLITLRFFVSGIRFKTVDLMLYLLSPVSTILSLSTLISVSQTESAEKYYTLIGISSAGLVFTNALTLLFFNKSSKMEEEKHELELMNRLNASERKRYNETERMYESIRIIRHDIKEQLSYIESTFARGDSDSAKRLINEVAKEMDSGNEIVHTGNRIIDNLLYSKSSIYPQLRFVLAGTISGLEVFEEAKLISLFSNMLDNAIEGVSDSSEKVINLEFSNISNYQNIICKNPRQNSILDKNPYLATSKTDSSMHGYGIKSMRRIVDSLNGMIEFYEKDNQFCCHIALPIVPKQRDMI